MKKLLSILVVAAFAMSASAHCGKCEGDKAKEAHKCKEVCKEKCAAKKDHKCTDTCKEKCAAAKKDGAAK